MNEETRCMKCGFIFQDKSNFLYDLDVKWGHWFEEYPGKYKKGKPNSTSMEALRYKCERCGYQWLVPTES